MTYEQPQEPALTPDQSEIADYFLEACGLTEFADQNLEMMGQSGSVRFGLGRCAHHLMDLTPDQVRAMVMTKLEAQANKS